MKAVFIVNERSGKKRRFDVAELIKRSDVFDSAVLPCSRKEDLDAMIDDAERNGVDVVFAVGGDGTVHETAKRLIGRKPALGILPIGSGNGFARHIGLPMTPADAIASCRGGRIVIVDTAQVNDDAFLGVMGVGFDAEIAHRFAASNVRGLRTYVQVGMRAFLDYRADEYEVIANGTNLREKAFVIAIANSGHYGNNARIAPLASLQDGMLDVVIVHEAKLTEAMFLLRRLFMGSLHRAKNVTTIQTRELTIRRTGAGHAHLDGEPVELGDVLHVRVKPASLRLLVPDGAKAI